MGQSGPGDVTRLLESWSAGDKNALNKLIPLVYRELRRLAAGSLRRERANHTLQPTALVHEAYLRLAGHAPLRIQNRTHFLAIAANLMRQILVNHAKKHQAMRRNGGQRVALVDRANLTQMAGVDLIALDESMEKLARLDPRQAQIVDLRFFGGLTEDEIADVLGVATITVKREWRIARAVLRQQLSDGVPDGGAQS